MKTGDRLRQLGIELPEPPKVLDAASDFFARALPGRSGHARTAFAHPQLPLDAAVELVVIVAVNPA